ncbi:1,4-alpha-glucan branching enzyme [Lachnospiraceae bacterium XBB2008]|nr:1,4-alpha-glucan branching enzyme [Lachnospiraceae bacterium XBB2008]
MNNRMYKLMNWPAIEAVVYAESDNPSSVLGPHASGNSTLYQVYVPGASEVRLQVPDEDKAIKMESVDEAGFFALLKSGKAPADYSYIAEFPDGKITRIEEAYRYDHKLPAKFIKDYMQGKAGNAYEYMGAHPTTMGKKSGTVFYMWAPNARRVSVVGDFNEWDGRVHQMDRIEGTGIFGLFVPGVKVGDRFYYEVNMKGGLSKTVLDPFSASVINDDGWFMSVVTDLSDIKWTDDRFIADRSTDDSSRSMPVSIFECSLSDFVSETDAPTYQKLGEAIAEHAASMNYTHVELKPVAEYENEASLGYETVAYYAPTSRFGTPEDFAQMIDIIHSRGLRVILDWTLAHPSSSNYALRKVDGTGCYEHEDPRQGIQPQWGTLLFNYGRGEVASFLKSNALYWIKEFHVDGLRIDSLAAVICLDYGRNSGDWIPNMYGGHENLDALEFIKNLNNTISRDFPGVITIAEDNSAWPQVTAKVSDGGLGFTYKWNIGWRDDYLRYIAKDPLFRGGSHNDLTLSMVYCYSDRFVLPLSVDDVNDRKLSIAYMMTHPGIKLMSCGLDKSRGKKDGTDKLVKALNQFYTKHPALYELDDDENGFEWINCMDQERCTLSYIRKSSRKSDLLVVVANFSGIEQEMKVGVSVPGKYTRIFNTDAAAYGGSTKGKEQAIYTIDDDVDSRPYYFPVTIPAASLSVFGYEPFDENDREYMLGLQVEAKKKADEAKADAEKEKAKAKAAQKKAETEEKKAREAAEAAEAARIKAEKEYEKAQAELEKARIAMEKAKEAAQRAELAAHRLKVTEESMKK